MMKFIKGRWYSSPEWKNFHIRIKEELPDRLITDMHITGGVTNNSLLKREDKTYTYKSDKYKLSRFEDIKKDYPEFDYELFNKNMEYEIY